MAKLPKAAVKQLEVFVDMVKADPSVLGDPDLAFFKEFIESYGGRVPEFTPKPLSEGSSPSEESEQKPAGGNTGGSEESAADEGIESEESDVELDTSGVIEDPDVAYPLPPFNETVEVSEEQMDQSNEKKREAISAYSEGEFGKAAELYTQAIELNPNSALLYAKRGQCYIQLKKPNACIRDCTRALEINPDCAPAYKFRGRANRLLGHWEEAAKDLRDACKIDFDEQADEWLREVTPNAKKIEEHKRKYERKRTEKEQHERMERIRKAREEHAKASAAQQQNLGGGEDAGPDAQSIFGLLNDPELMEAFKDPEVAAAFQEISKNPASYMKYQSNPKIASVINKMASKYSNLTGGMGGFGGMGGGMGGFPGGAGGFFPGGAPTAPSPNDDVGLD